MTLEPDELALLAETREIQIETSQQGGSSHRTIIWVVVDGEDAFVRSVNGKTARWYREALANPDVTIHAKGRSVRVKAVLAADPASAERITDALKRKYARTAGIRPMLQPDILDANFRLDPA